VTRRAVRPVAVVLALAALGLTAGLSLGGGRSAASNGRPVLDIVFVGTGSATFKATGPDALGTSGGVSSASITGMRWTLRWHTDLGAPKPDDYLSEQLRAGDISGSSKIVRDPRNGPSCSGPVKPFQNPYGREQWKSIAAFPGRTALPVPMEYGFAADPCWNFLLGAKGGGGTGWFAMDDGTVAPGLARSEAEMNALLPRNVFSDPKGGRYPVSGDLDKTYPVTGGSGTVVKTMHWTGHIDIFVNGKGPKQGPQPPTPTDTKPRATSPEVTTTTPPEKGSTPSPVRNAAREKLLQELRRANPFCLTIVDGNGWIVQGPAGSTETELRKIVGDELVDASKKACKEYARLIGDTINIYDDPPRNDVGVIAVPAASRRVTVSSAACTTYTGPAQTFCQTLATRLGALLTATGKTTAVADALAATVARESAAAKAGNKTALHAQQANALHLLPQFTAVSRAEEAAGAAVSTFLRANDVNPALSPALVGKAQAAVLHQLVLRGIGKARLARIPGVVLRPFATTLSTALAGH
jgi:hypothetical protein